MKIFDIYDTENRLLAFEVGNLSVGRRAVCRIVESLPDARIIRRPKLLSWLREQSFCEFELDGQRFEVEEPFGDNSRYWVGPVPPRPQPTTSKVRDAFAAFRDG